MLSLKGCTSVREPLNKDTGCGEGVSGCRSGTASRKEDLWLCVRSQRPFTLTYANNVCSSETQALFFDLSL